MILLQYGFQTEYIEAGFEVLTAVVNECCHVMEYNVV
jgi:hypothetical protein